MATVSARERAPKPPVRAVLVVSHRETRLAEQCKQHVTRAGRASNEALAAWKRALRDYIVAGRIVRQARAIKGIVIMAWYARAGISHTSADNYAVLAQYAGKSAAKLKKLQTVCNEHGISGCYRFCREELDRREAERAMERARLLAPAGQDNKKKTPRPPIRRTREFERALQTGQQNVRKATEKQYLIRRQRNGVVILRLPEATKTDACQTIQNTLGQLDSANRSGINRRAMRKGSLRFIIRFDLEAENV